MKTLFNRKPNPKEALRESKREMNQATRGIEKEIGALQLEEKKLVAEIKRTAKTGNEAATKILARQLVRLRQQIANLQGSRAQMRGVATHTQAMYAQSSISVGMKGASKAMSAINKQMAPAKQAKVIQEFQKQSAQMDMTTEMMSDAIDDALDNDEAEDETEELTNQKSLKSELAQPLLCDFFQEVGKNFDGDFVYPSRDTSSQHVSLVCGVFKEVLDEIGVDVASQLSTAPKGRIATKQSEDVGSSGIDELEKRLAALKNP